VKKEVYAGPSAPGSLLYTEERCNQMSIANCDYWVAPYGINLEDRITLPNGMMKDTMSSYCPPWGCLSSPYEVDESSWYTSGTPAWARKKITNYTVVGPNWMMMVPASTEVEDGSGNVVAETDFAYDQFGLIAGGATMHQTATNYGNLTTITTHTSGSATLTKTIQYWDTGEPYLVTVNGLQTYHDYQCNGALPDHVWRAGEPAGDYDETWVYNCGFEEPTSLTDANGAQTSWQYGTTVGYGLPTQITHPDNSVTNITYTGWTGPGTAASTESVTNFNGASEDDYTVFDSQGRTALAQRWNGANWDTVTTFYDGDGRAWDVSAPRATSKGNSGGTAFTATSFDGAGRPVEVDGPTGGWTKYTYTDNDVLVERGPAPAGGGGASQERQMEYDALGRLTSVCELTAGTGTWPSGTCGQTVSQSGYGTEYAYNLLDKMTSVTQNAQSAGSHETRSFAYDELGRMTQETTPEAGTTSFWFDTPDGSQCTASSPGDLVERKDNAGNYTCYGYDGRHRLTQVTYPSGPNAGATASRHFVYDATADGSISLSKTLGRLSEAYTQTTGGVQVDEAFSYNISGQVADYYQSSPNSGGYYHSGETYFANGMPDALSIPVAPASTISATYGLDGAGRVNAATANGAAVVQAAGTAYSPLGLTNVEFGSGDSDSYGYNAAGETTGYTFSVNGHTDSGTPTWNADGSLQQLAVSDNIPGANDNGTLCTFSEDDLGRLNNEDCGTAEDQTFQYDPFGNMKTDVNAGTGYAFTANFSLDNQVSGDTDYPAGYDADGNLTEDPVTGAASAYDAEGKVVTLGGSAVIYDALGRTVEAGDHELVYGASGALMAEMSGQTAVNEYVPLPGGGAAVYQGTTLAYYRHVDWQGSARLATTPSRTLYSATQYAAFGQLFNATSATPDLSFTGKQQLYGNDTYNFPMRNLSPIQGRWLTPDPAGLAAVDPTNPQSWNAYAYVNGNPLEETDPLGLCTESGGFINGVMQVNGCTQDIPLEDALAQQAMEDLINGTNQYRRYPFGHPPIFIGVVRASRPLVPGIGSDPNNGAPWYRNSCITSALGKGALSVGVDSIGLIPEAGGISRMIGHGAGYFGVVADRAGYRVVDAVGHTGAAAQGLNGLTDTSGTGVLSTGLTIAGFIPGLGQGAAVLSMVNDAIKTGIAISKCP